MGGLIWKDSTGNIYGIGAELLYVDAAGRIWNIDAQTGQISEPQLYSVRHYWTGPDCTGVEYVYSPPPSSPLPLPRQPFRLPGETQYRIRADAAMPMQVSVSSMDDGTGCSNITATTLAVPLAQLPAIGLSTPPRLSSAGALHLEAF